MSKNKIPIDKFLSYDLELSPLEKQALDEIIENEFLNYHDVYQTNKREPQQETIKPEIEEIKELDNLTLSIEPKENKNIVIIDQ